MTDLRRDVEAFVETRRAETARARQVVAFQLACGVDLSTALEKGPHVAARYAAKVRRLLERERLRGVRRHWTYDLDRHIALKQVLDELTAIATAPAHAASNNESGAGAPLQKAIPD